MSILSPAPVQPNDGPYEYQAFPAWFYGPEGKSAAFERAEDVPDGWVDYDAFMAGELAEAEDSGITGEDKLRQLTADQRASAVGKLVDANTQAQLVDILAAMQEADDKVEFLPSWPKQKLAETIVDNGGPPEEADGGD